MADQNHIDSAQNDSCSLETALTTCQGFFRGEKKGTNRDQSGRDFDYHSCSKYSFLHESEAVVKSPKE